MENGESNPELKDFFKYVSPGENIDELIEYMNLRLEYDNTLEKSGIALLHLLEDLIGRYTGMGLLTC